jgi:hypothetical protein
MFMRIEEDENCELCGVYKYLSKIEPQTLDLQFFYVKSYSIRERLKVYLVGCSVSWTNAFKHDIIL